MPGIVCLGDATTHGGKVITATSTLFYQWHSGSSRR